MRPENDPVANERPAGARPAPADRIDLFLRLLRWRRAILLNTLAVAAAAVIVSLLLPKWYRSTASLLPPEEETLALGGLSRGMSSALAAARGAGISIAGRMSLPMWATPSDLVAGILRSRRLQDQVIAEHDLVAVMRCKNLDRAREAFAERFKVRVGGEGIVRVGYLDREPERAAAVLGSALRALDEIQREARRSSAAGVRAFVAERLAGTSADLRAAEERLRAFEETHGLLVPEEQARALVAAVARVEGERLAALVERDALAAQVGAGHPEVVRLDAQVRALEAARAGLEGRSAGTAGVSAGPSGGSARGAIIDLGRLPELSMEFLRLYREVEIQQALYALLVEMHEQHRIQEVRDTPTIQLLDPPVVPLEKARPRRALIVVLATLIAFLAGVGAAAAADRWARLAEEDPERRRRLQRLLRGVGLGFLAGR
ncbi:MAG: hypothetical protein FJY75_08740 [Candidatus Eisenbacteria bacterium]|uniref:Tyrosine kinase G-rich domain-containing protein n=1 Tax=Eiseniibacteriota bacterium TaxID=2212470 RepID=A0A938BP39_UNCEI|nr:hypothetical protein [Candidatus Eisenbacteria bacterium]